jgi:hypothetical protein
MALKSVMPIMPLNKLVFCGAPGRIRTHDPQIRSLVLYPAELPVLRGPPKLVRRAPNGKRREAMVSGGFSAI